MPRSRTSPRPRKTAFVPRAALAGVFSGAGVIPRVAAVAAAAAVVTVTMASAGCGGKESGAPAGSVDSGSDVVQFGVACLCFDGSMGVAADAFGFDAPLGVAMRAFDGGDAATTSDAPATTDGAFGVAADACGGG